MIIAESKEFSVGAGGIEPPTSCTPCKRASRTAPRPVMLDIIARSAFSGNADFLLKPTTGRPLRTKTVGIILICSKSFIEWSCS